MYSLLSGIYSYYTRQEVYSILIIGLDNAGKTTLLEKIKHIFMGKPGLSADKIAPTVGLNIAKITMEPRKLLNLWDLGGQKDLQSIWEKYYMESHGIIFVVDATDKQRIEECKLAFEKLLHNDHIEGIPILMLANKQDVEGKSLSVEEIKEIFNKIASKLSARDSTVLPVSALTGDGVKQAIDWIWSRMLFNKEHRAPILK